MRVKLRVKPPSLRRHLRTEILYIGPERVMQYVRAYRQQETTPIKQACLWFGLGLVCEFLAQCLDFFYPSNGRLQAPTSVAILLPAALLSACGYRLWQQQKVVAKRVGEYSAFLLGAVGLDMASPAPNQLPAQYMARIPGSERLAGDLGTWMGISFLALGSTAVAVFAWHKAKPSLRAMLE